MTRALITLLLAVVFAAGQAKAQVSSRFRQPHSVNQFEVLVYTSADRWHNLTESVAIPSLQEMANRHAFGLTHSMVSETFRDADLRRFDVVVFLHSTAESLTDGQRASLRRFIQKGGGFVGIHAAAVTDESGEWFQRLVGRRFTDHPEEQTAVLSARDKDHPATLHLPDRWLWTDEWYSFSEPLTDTQTVLLTVDESSYDPDRTWGDDSRKTAMGAFHPIAWYQEFDGGRSFYTALGHMPALYRDARFLDHIYGGIFWAASGRGLAK